MESFTKLDGLVVPIDRANVDTDAIIPKQFLKSVKRTGFGPNLFDEWRYLDHGEPGLDNSKRPLNPDFVLNQARYQGAQVLLARRNFGCGSSREHAPQALTRWGIQGIVALSFAEIFFGNCLAMGVPCVTAGADDLERLYQAAEAQPQREFVLDVATGELTAGELRVQGHIPPGARDSLLHGTWNATLVLKEAGREIDAVAAQLPYLHDFAG